jgi:hypothetical protein
MKSLSKKTRYLIVFASLLLVVLITGLNVPNHSTQALAETSPTPTALQENGEYMLKSGDTEALILGAGIILFIILGGVIIQRMLLKESDQISGES